jgi:hypothetical protein
MLDELHAPPLFPAQQTVPAISLVVMLGHDGASVCRCALTRIAYCVSRNFVYLWDLRVNFSETSEAPDLRLPEGSNEAQA